MLIWSAAAAAAKSLQSCPTLWDPIDGSPPGSPVPGILQARTLKWVAISFSNAGKWKGKVKSLSRVRLFATPWTVAHQAPLSMGFSSVIQFLKETPSVLFLHCSEYLQWHFRIIKPWVLCCWNQLSIQSAIEHSCPERVAFQFRPSERESLKKTHWRQLGQPMFADCSGWISIWN